MFVVEVEHPNVAQDSKGGQGTIAPRGHQRPRSLPPLPLDENQKLQLPLSRPPASPKPPNEPPKGQSRLPGGKIINQPSGTAKDEDQAATAFAFAVASPTSVGNRQTTCQRTVASSDD
uniref:Uncharacterized protein n=1 Tax=Micrurus lemniscatus lemniscatus TaxID=129467 RepID=A0A2D4JLL9_MICLE